MKSGLSPNSEVELPQENAKYAEREERTDDGAGEISVHHPDFGISRSFFAFLAFSRGQTSVFGVGVEGEERRFSSFTFALLAALHFQFPRRIP